jgi:1-pyrroline-5-carboxylate dehydrogenase
VAGIVFTGSREVGYRLMSESSKTRPRPVIAELGGKNATIVADSANLDKAAEGSQLRPRFHFQDKNAAHVRVCMFRKKSKLSSYQS